MFGFLRRRRLPAGARPALDGDERIVAWAGGPGDEVVVVTNLGLWLPGAAARLGWHEIHKATWSGRQLTLVAAASAGSEGGYEVMVDRPATVHTLLDPDDVPQQVRARVSRSIAYSQHHPPGIRVVGRRVPGVDGLHWTVRYDDGVDPADPQVRQATAELVDFGRASVSGAAP